MLAAERRDHLLELLARQGKIVAKEVAAELGISEDSVRRDLRDLAAEGLCQRVYGGALPVSPAVVDYGARQSVAPDGKRKVASVAAGLVRPGGTVILDGGTTALAVAHALPRDLACTVITHSPPIAVALLDHPQAEVFVLGAASSSTRRSPAVPPRPRPRRTSPPTSSSSASPACIPRRDSRPATPRTRR